MNDAVHETLRTILRHDPEAINDPARLEGLLRDRCPKDRREIASLLAAHHAGVPREISSSSRLPWETLATRLTRRLLDDQPLTEEAARWAVRGWGAALGRGPHEDIKPASPVLPTPRPSPPAWAAPVGLDEDTPPIRMRRPWWVCLVAGGYVGLLLMLLALPVLAGLLSGGDSGALVFLYASIPVAILFLLGGSLVVVPIGNYAQIPSMRRAVWIPILGSSVCALLLVGGGALAVHELLFHPSVLGRDPSGVFGWMFLFGTGGVWLIWIVVFSFLAWSTDPLTLNGRMYKMLIAGGVLELLVAIQSHIIVRQRKECCAGEMTMLGIVTGSAMMLVALGPGVFFLFYRRYQQAYARRRAKVEE